jgi:hypothetical protein
MYDQQPLRTHMARISVSKAHSSMWDASSTDEGSYCASLTEDHELGGGGYGIQRSSAGEVDEQVSCCIRGQDIVRCIARLELPMIHRAEHSEHPIRCCP